MAKKSAKKTSKKSATKSVNKTTKKVAAKSAKKATSKKAGSRSGSRRSYDDVLKKKVIAAIRKGMTHLEASDAFDVGIHSIPGWLRKFAAKAL